ncbi:MAG: hypothetical protein OES47_08100 [Acidobacteriota bacterium]|nr:hypothetical protein [Acidobacteriota bacterium]
MTKRWKKGDETYLKRYSKGKRLEELAERFKTDSETVAAKLQKMALEAKDMITPMRIENDPLIKEFEGGVKALQGGDFKKAKALLQKVVDETDFPQLGQRARRFLVLCDQKLTKTSGGTKDPFLLAVYERNRGKLEEALEICVKGGRVGKDERFAYLAASLHALLGDQAEAARALVAAIEMNPKNRVHAFHDSDFGELRESQEYSSLFDQP